jgi:hypothetical protein
MSFLGIGGAAGAGGFFATTGVIAASVVGGAVAAVVLTAGGTQIAQNVTQPDATAANLHNVSEPNYAD